MQLDTSTTAYIAIASYLRSYTVTYLTPMEATQAMLYVNQL